MAKFAGVSLATADRVINNRTGVREVTRKKVMDAIDQLGYEPDPLAARLARSKKQKFAFVVPSDGNLIFQSIERCWSRLQASSAYTRVSLDLVFYAIDDYEELMQQLHQASKRADGILLAAPDTERSRQIVKGLTEQGIPISCIFSQVGEKGAHRYIGYDHTKLGRTAAHFLRLLTNGQNGQILTHTAFQGMAAAQERLRGQQAYINEHDWPVDLVHMTSSAGESRASELFIEHLEQNEDVIGMICMGHEIADLLAALRERPDLNGRHKIISVVIDMDRHIVEALQEGHIDAVFFLDAGKVAKHAVRLLSDDIEKRRHRQEGSILPPQILDFSIFVKDNLPQWALSLAAEA
ncbi:MAG: LacI family DNA-binding transcriptional regulator [Cohaesibacter sp.]|nr:LacI family DNA-binding transcriptional regulator [Cohaesibacter sp.]